MGIDFDDTFDGGIEKPRSRSGVQRFRSNHKYNTRGVPVLQAKPRCIFRPYPAVASLAENPTIVPLVENGQITWIRFEYSVDTAGLRFPQINRAVNFWLIPSDIFKFWPEKAEKLLTRDDRLEFAVLNSPYSKVYYGISKAEEDAAVPREWSKMLNKRDWAAHLGLDPNRDKVFTPVPRPEEHALVQGMVVSNGGGPRNREDFDRLTYEDGRSPGSLHPAVLEFSKSASRELRYGELRRIGGTEGDQVKDASMLYAQLADPQQGKRITLIGDRVLLGEDKKEQRGYNIHTFALESAQEHPVKVDEILNDWHPWETDIAVGAILKPKILLRQTAQQQVEILIGAYGAELVAYCLQGTPYLELMPEAAQSTYEDYKAQRKTFDDQHWTSMMTDRFGRSSRQPSNHRSFHSSSAGKSPESPAQPANRPMDLTKNSIHELLARATNGSGDVSIGGYDEEQAKALLARLDASRAGQKPDTPPAVEPSEVPEPAEERQQPDTGLSDNDTL